MIAAAVYCRKSTDQNIADEEKSVARQAARAREYAERKGWTIADEHIYVDDGISGADFVRREGYLRLMNALKPRAPFQALVMMEQSRLGRSQDEVPYALRRITEAGVRVYCYLTDTEIKRATAIEKFQSNAMAFVDEMHREQSRQRTRDALRRRAELGHVAGGVVYGYVNREVRQGDRRSHVVREIHPDQAEVVRRIFREIARGDGFSRIAKRLNAEGVPAPRLGRHGWATSGVRELVLRDLYRGRVVYGKTRWEDRDGSKHKRDTPASEWIVREMPELQIIPDALWPAAQSRLEATRKLYARLADGTLIGRPGSTLERAYLLTGFLACGLCGGSVYVLKRPSRGESRWVYYVCATQRHRGTCPGGGIRIAMSHLDTAVLDTIEAQLLSPDRLEAIIAHVAARAQADETVETRRGRCERQLREARAKVDRYVRAIGEGLDLAEIREQLMAAKAMVATLDTQLSALAGPTPIDLERIRARVADWRGILRRGPSMARQILRKILPGKLALTPIEGGVAFRGPAAWGDLFAGTVYGRLVVPPG